MFGRAPEPQRNWRRRECVFLTCFEQEFHFLAALLRSGGVYMQRADTVEEADFLLTVSEAHVLLCDVAFLDGTWREAAAMLSSVHPGVPLIVVADSSEALETLIPLYPQVHSVIRKPISFTSLRRAICAAQADALVPRASG